MKNNKKLSITDFIKKSNNVHNNTYDYSKSKYVNNSTKIKIICSKHGIFEQRPMNHINGNGCPKCSGNKQYGTLDFINKSLLVHGKKYDYSETEYINSRTKLKIKCLVHGIFEQKPTLHLRGNGCPKCFSPNEVNTESFIKRSKKIHNDFYDYSETVYNNSRTKLKIKCPIHGFFEQIPTSHLKGMGCKMCSNSKSKIFNNYKSWEKMGNESNNFDSFKIYVIELSNEEERFYKFGITYNILKNRFIHFKNYEIKLLHCFSGEAEYIYNIEEKIKKYALEQKINYVPMQKIEGSTECFNDINLIENFLFSNLDYSRTISVI